jgi:DNA topoisomerase-2
LKKYETPEEIINDFYDIRLDFYEKRKQYMIEVMTSELMVLSNKARYIQELLDDTLDLRKKKSKEIIHILEDKGYDKIQDDNDYKYLIKMPMDSVSEENVEKIMKEKDEKEIELNLLKSKEIKNIWSEELQVLQSEYLIFNNNQKNTSIQSIKKTKSSKTIKSSKTEKTKLVKHKKLNLVIDE